MTQETYDELLRLSQQLDKMSQLHTEEDLALQRKHEDESRPLLRRSYTIRHTCDHILPSGESAVTENEYASFTECSICGEIWELTG